MVPTADAQLINGEVTTMTQHTTTTLNTVNPAFGEWFGDVDSGRIKIGHSYSGTSEKTLDQHAHLYLEGNQQTHVYLLQSGVIGTYKMLSDGRRQIVGFAYPGDMLGLDHPNFYANSAEALSECKVRCIPIKAIDKLIETEPGFGQTILRMTSQELADAREQLVSLGRKSAMEKLATFLLRIARRNEQFGLDGDTVHLPMKRADIGDYLGLTIETVSRNMTKLKVSQVIKLKSNSEVCILDRQALECLADGNGAM